MRIRRLAFLFFIIAGFFVKDAVVPLPWDAVLPWGVVLPWEVGLPKGITQTEGTLVVSADGPYLSINEAIAAAIDGDTIEVRGGTYPGPLVVEKSVTLRGIDWPAIDGEHAGTVIRLLAPGITFEGFRVINSGAVLDEENSGIAGEAPDLIIQNNRFEDTLFGIYLREAHNSVIRGNVISSKVLDLPRRGDPIRVWFSNFVLIEDNAVSLGRDVVLWYSEHLTVKNNTVEEGRYGLHFMYCDDALIENNRLTSNSVGAFLMYSRRMHLIHNTIAFNRGPSGYGIGLKDMDDALVRDNLFLDNRIGAHLDNSPREIDSTGIFNGNVFAFNDIGVELMPSTKRNQFSMNSFMDNQEQVAIAGGGLIEGNFWTVEGQGNYWSDYVGYDEGEDGWGDEPYRSERLFEDLIDRYPNLRMFVYSPSAQAVDFAARAVPLVKPQPKLTDDAPLMSPVIPVGLPPLQEADRSWLGWASGGLLGLAVLLILIPYISLNKKQNLKERTLAIHGGDWVIHVQNLQKRYGKVLAVDALSFDVKPGEAIALWGPNGAGKTTVLRSLLGVIPFSGSVTLSGFDVQTKGKAARKFVGFVPQELSFHDDLSILETIQFYARLKKINPSPAENSEEDALARVILDLLTRLELAQHLQKQVGELSGGMKQRLALAIALLDDPPILMLDEPTSNLDVHGRDDLLDLLTDLKAEGKTLVFSSHRFDEVTRLADRVLVMENGRLIADKSPDLLHEFSGWRASLRLVVPQDRVESALQTLRAAGFSASPNGKGVWVKVDPNLKGLPIKSLMQAGIPVQDFEIDRSEKERIHHD